MAGGWTAGFHLIWNRPSLAGRKDVSPVLLAATSTLPVSPSDLLAPLAAAVALLGHMRARVGDTVSAFELMRRAG
jgi:hypothetical protein